MPDIISVKDGRMTTGSQLSIQLTRHSTLYMVWYGRY